MGHDARIVDLETARALHSEAQAFARAIRRVRAHLAPAGTQPQGKAALAAMEPCVPRD